MLAYTPPVAPASTHLPGDLWIEKPDPGRFSGSEVEYVVWRCDTGGYEYEWIYLYRGELEKLSRAALGLLVKRAHDSG